MDVIQQRDVIFKIWNWVKTVKKRKILHAILTSWSENAEKYWH